MKILKKKKGKTENYLHSILPQSAILKGESVLEKKSQLSKVYHKTKIYSMGLIIREPGLTWIG